ncbi:class I SAM-dependent methyltransferase [Sphaerisporangium album]|uniref:Class I SAM-dependent methyltransferase n=1 Tax=Sphaerisporangium album TaxID=509200 RepID=A0A367FTP6_9ACTN|nr:class I SAM-dependent methyltransferase [Sphaerisporangium album]RCG33172.1 class I SAM-dependent methyltransferase [Sphaerisporangium album]
MTREKVDLTGDKETLLATLYGRAAHSRSADPVLRDPLAEQAVDRLDYDFGKLRMRSVDALSVAIRVKTIDRLTAAHLAETPDATVIHLACGLDTRVYRLDPPPTVRWFDIDFPDVIELREHLFPPRPGYTMIGLPATDPAWLDRVPADAPVLVVAEGLTMYLTASEVHDLLSGITARFPSGEIMFDALSRLAVKLGCLEPAIRATGATLRWGIDDPAELAASVPRLRLEDQLFYSDVPEVSKLPAGYRAALAIMNRIYFLRRIGSIIRYRF